MVDTASSSGCRKTMSRKTGSTHWLHQALHRKPRSFSDIHPYFIRELASSGKKEEILELSDLLTENFLRYDGIGDVPSQIHSYLSSISIDLRNLPKNSPSLQGSGKDRWYLSDPGKAGAERSYENAHYCGNSTNTVRLKSSQNAFETRQSIRFSQNLAVPRLRADRLSRANISRQCAAERPQIPHVVQLGCDTGAVGG